jgi:hypothetical protein
MNVIADERKFVIKRKMLQILYEESGQNKKAIREFLLGMIASSGVSDTQPEEARRALDALAGDGYATHDYDELNGIVWRITDSGLSAAANIDKTKPEKSNVESAP